MRRGVLALSHLGVTAIENQETMPGGVSLHPSPLATLPDAISTGGEGIMPEEGICTKLRQQCYVMVLFTSADDRI